MMPWKSWNAIIGSRIVRIRGLQELLKSFIRLDMILAMKYINFVNALPFGFFVIKMYDYCVVGFTTGNPRDSSWRRRVEIPTPSQSALLPTTENCINFRIGYANHNHPITIHNP